MVQRRTRGPDLARRIHLNSVEKAIIVSQAALIKLERPNIAWGPCLIEARDRAVLTGELAAERKPSDSHLKASAIGGYRPMVEAEIHRIVEERATQAAIQQAAATELAERSRVPAPAPRPLEADNEVVSSELSDMMRIGQQAAVKFLGPMVSAIGNEFERMLELELRGRASTVMGRMGHSMSIVNPVPQGMVAATVVREKPVVALVGNPTDNLYFQRCTQDLEDFFTFLPVQRLGDTPEAKDASFVVMTGSASTSVENAIRAICLRADIVKGKASHSVREHLIKAGLTPIDQLAFSGEGNP